MAVSGSRTLKFVLDGNAKGLQQALGKGEKSVGKFRSGLKKLALIAGGAFAVTKVVQFGKDIVGLSRELEDLDRKAASVFEDSLPGVKKWADQNKTAFGLTNTETVSLAANFADLLKPMGFTAEQATGMSQDVLGLSGALSSWSGGQRSAAEVSEILSKAMLGEREQLKSLGISISEADVKARLAAKGQENLTGEALAQAKALATQELIMEKSTDAQEAWANGGKDAAEQQNKWRVSMGELRERIARGLTPVIQKVTEWIGKLADWINTKGIPAAREFGGWFRDNVLPVLQQVAGFIRDQVIPVIQAMAQWIRDNKETVFAFVGVLAVALAGLKAFMFIKNVTLAVKAFSLALAANPIGLVIVAIALLVAGFVWLFNNVEGFRNFWKKAWEVIQKVIDAVWGWIKKNWPLLLAILTGPIGLAVLAIAKNWDKIKAGATAVKDWIVEKFNAVKDFISGLPDKISTAASGLFDGIKNAFKSAINWVIDKWNGISFSLPSIDLPFGLGSFGGQTFSVPQIPKLHSGGLFMAPPGQSEGLALLRDGERVLTPEQDRGGNVTVNVMLSSEAIAGIAEVVVRRGDRETRRGILAGTGVTV